MMRPQHDTTVELTAEQIERGAREHEYSLILQRCRSDQMTDEEWQSHLRNEGFCAWVRGL